MSSSFCLSFFSISSPSSRSCCRAAASSKSRCIRPHLRLAHRAAHRKRYVHADDAIERDAGDLAAGRLQQPRGKREIERPGAIVHRSLATGAHRGVHHVEALVADHRAVEPALRLEPIERRVRGASAPWRRGAARGGDRALDLGPDVDTDEPTVGHLHFEGAGKIAKQRLAIATRTAQVRGQRSAAAHAFLIQELSQHRRRVDAGQALIESQLRNRRGQVVAQPRLARAAEQRRPQRIELERAVAHGEDAVDVRDVHPGVGGASTGETAPQVELAEPALACGRLLARRRRRGAALVPRHVIVEHDPIATQIELHGRAGRAAELGAPGKARAAHHRDEVAQRERRTVAEHRLELDVARRLGIPELRERYTKARQQRTQIRALDGDRPL